MEFTIDIPIQPHLKKYVLKKFNSRSDTIRINTTRLGLAFMNMFSKKPDIYRKKFELSFTDNLKIVFSQEFSNRAGFFVSKQNIYYLNKALHEEFEERLFDYLDGMKLSSDKFQINQSISDFCYKFRIDPEDIAIETLRKAYYRHRLKEKQLYKDQYVS